MLKKYKSWNTFEKRWFWSNLILTTLGVYSIFYFKHIIMLIIFEIFLIYYRRVIYKSLEAQERTYLNKIIDPITNEVMTNNLLK